MRFEEALEAMREGKKVKHSGLYRPTYICMHTNSFGETYNAVVSDIKSENSIVRYPHAVSHNDIFAEDWEIVDE